MEKEVDRERNGEGGRKGESEREIKREREGKREGSLVVRVTDFSEHNASNFLSLTMRQACV